MNPFQPLEGLKHIADAIEDTKKKVITIPVRYVEGEGMETLVRHPLDPTHLCWSPF